jgi:hypothetical protein
MPKSNQELERLDDLICALDPNDAEYDRRYWELIRRCTQEDIIGLADIAQRRAEAAQRQLRELWDK